MNHENEINTDASAAGAAAAAAASAAATVATTVKTVVKTKEAAEATAAPAASVLISCFNSFTYMLPVSFVICYLNCDFEFVEEINNKIFTVSGLV